MGLAFHKDSSVAEAQEITYGSVLKLMHESTKCRLHSRDIPYTAEGKHQVVTGLRGVHDSNSYWIVKPPDGSSFQQGDTIPDGSIIKLQHMQTRKWLHSRPHQSPISKNAEVSGYGGDNDSDTGDLWMLEFSGKGKVWMRDQKVRLKHVDTGIFLHSHEMMYTRVVTGQMEVCGVTDKTANNIWIAAEGVYLPMNKKASSSS